MIERIDTADREEAPVFVSNSRRPRSPAAGRNQRWEDGLVGSASGSIPPLTLCRTCRTLAHIRAVLGLTRKGMGHRSL